MAIIILITLIALFITASGYFKNTKQGNWYAFIIAVVIFSAYTAITTELLNLFNAINFTTILSSWLILLIAIITTWWKRGKQLPEFKLASPLLNIEKYIGLSLFVILFVTLITAVFAYPNNWDSMTYHLSRVMHWMQNENVKHYPTRIDRQLTQPPLAEYHILHLFILGNRDSIANLVQWLFFAGSITSVALITAEFGGDRKAQLLSAFVAATIPMAILQSTSTQNDLVVAFFVLTAILFGIKAWKQRFNTSYVYLFYITCALALLSKGTALIFLLPVVLVYAFFIVKTNREKAIPSILKGIAIVLLLYGPFAYRNYQTYNSPLGKSYELNNSVYTIEGTISNISKNTTMHLRTPVPAINNSVTNGVTAFNKAIGVDVNAPNYNWAPSPDFVVGYFSTQEDSAGNFFQVILLVLVLVYVVIKFKSIPKHILLYTTLLVCMYVLFNLLLKWQIWHARLHLTMFLAGAVLIAYWLNKLPALATYTMVVVLSAFSLIFLVYNQTRPLFGEQSIFKQPADKQYFAANEPLYAPFVKVNALLQENNCQTLGYISGGDSWEYPFWALNKNNKSFSMYQLDTDNETKQLPQNTSSNIIIPDMIINIRGDEKKEEQISYMSNPYKLILLDGVFAVYKKDL